MNQRIALGLTLLAGVVIGATAIQGLHAQAKPQAIVVVDIREITDPDVFKVIPASPATSPSGLERIPLMLKHSLHAGKS